MWLVHNLCLFGGGAVVYSSTEGCCNGASPTELQCLPSIVRGRGQSQKPEENHELIEALVPGGEVN